MPTEKDPTLPMRNLASGLSKVIEGAACNQASFKFGKTSFFFVGPGAKGQGFKAMFKLGASLPEVTKLAAKDPDRFGAGATGWVTARFTADKPLPKALWQKWIKEAYALTKNKPVKKKATRAKTAKKKTKVVKKKAAKQTTKRNTAARKKTAKRS